METIEIEQVELGVLLSFFLFWGGTRSLHMPALRPASEEYKIVPFFSKNCPPHG